MANVSKGLKFSTVKKGLSLTIENTDLVTCIVGHAGIGKTQLVRSVAEEKGYYFRELTCSLLQEGDLAFPRVSGDRVIYILNEAIVDIIDYCHDHPGQGAVLFLDEFNRATVQVQSELMNLVLQREVMGTKLPDECYLVLAENPSSDIEGFEDSSYATNAGDAAINDRTMRIRMRADLEDWIQNFATVEVDGRPRIYPAVTQFLREQGEEAFLVVDESRDKNPTPRAYERISIFLYQLIDQGEDLQDPDIHPYLLEGIEGCIGENYGQALYQFLTTDYAYIDPQTFLDEKGPENAQDLLDQFDDMEEIRKKAVLTGILEAIVKDEGARKDTDVACRFTELAERVNKDTLAAILHKMTSAEYDDEDPNQEGYKEFSETLYQEDQNGQSVTGFYPLAASILKSSLS